ncbi:MAG TPA: T9SS type A sorting domain-containing protein [Candidatus Kapabacteria bacterium]|nr:T9SS type A sorting domain-containing protein [Candidatus Kapabacteria bacterium]
MNKSLAICASLIVLFLSQCDADAQWVQTNGPHGGYITALASTATDIYAGTAGTGVYRSTDNGFSWTSLSNDPNMQSVFGIAAKGDTVVCAAISYATDLISSNRSCFVFYSSDKGTHWNASGITLPVSGSVLAINDSIILVGGVQLLSLKNNLNDWKSLNFGDGNINAIAVVRQKIYAGSISGCSISLNNGNIWNTINVGLPVQSVFSLASIGDTVFAGTGAGLFVTTSNGAIWDSLSLAGYPIKLLETGSNVMMACTDSEVFTSSDNGIHWTVSKNGLANTPVNNACMAGGCIFEGFSGPTGELLKSTNNGTTWTTATNGIVNTDINSIHVIGDTLWATTYGSGIFSTSNNGIDWVENNNGLSDLQIASFAALGNNLFTGINGVGIFRSTDGGRSWDLVDSISPNSMIRGLTAVGNELFICTDGGLFGSVDTGASWNLLTANFVGVPQLQHGSILFAGVNISNGGVYQSTDSGKTWTYSGLSNATVTSLINDNGNIFAGTNAGVYYTSDNGANWLPTGLTTPYNSVSISSLAAGGGNLFAGTHKNGIYYSSDNGATWYESNAGLIDTAIQALAVYGSNVFVGTQIHGVWKRSINDFVTAVNENPSASPAQFSLLQNYPNPFSGMTNFEFEIPNEEHVTLKIYNALGEEVATLVNGETAAGEHSATLNAHNLQKGIYFYKLTAGKYAQTGKMAVVK